MIPGFQDAADTGGAVGSVVVLGVLGVVKDLVDVFGICAFQEDDVRPPFLQVRADLDELVHVLVIRIFENF